MRYAALLCLAAFRLAADVNSTVYIPHVVDGGYWQTIFTIVNLAPRAAAQATLHLWAEDGSPMAVPVAGMGGARLSQIEVNLPPSGVTTVETTGDPASPTTQGWADFDVKTSGLVSITAIMRWSIPGRPDYEAVLPSRKVATSSQIFVYDHKYPAAATGYACMNASRVNDGAAAVTVRDENGQIMTTATLKVPAGQHFSFSMTDQFPDTAGRRGTIEFNPQPGGWFGFVGLRFNASGPITNLEAMSP